jgi:hypothetical protein
MSRSALLLALMVGCACAAQATPLSVSVMMANIGTPDQQREAVDACGKDARLYCRELKTADGAMAYLACLQQNRTRLTTRCSGLLARYGQ